ncbi:MAG: hypothetical protein KDK78_08675, partial [Chlamydiia bacterium]|nr:hypothetical protein [Chlamydiia bacterium]
EDGARYRLYVARNFLVEAIEGQAPSFPQDYRELLQQSLDEDAVEEAFHLLKDSMKAQAWMSMSSLPYIHRHLLRSIRVVWGFHQLIVPRIALMGLSPRIESEVRIRSESWLPNRGFNSIADLLEFAQSQFIPWEPDRVKRLYVLAQHYGVDTLIRACEEKLCDSWFDQENEIELADLAEHYHMPVYEDRRVARLRRKNAPRVSNEPWYEPIARQRK